MTEEKKIIVAVLDDESKIRVALKRLLETHGFDDAMYESWPYFLATVQSRRPDGLLLDLPMPAISGFEILERIATLRPPVATVVISGCDEPGNEARVRGLGAVNYLLKLLDETTLVRATHEVWAVTTIPAALPR